MLAAENRLLEASSFRMTTGVGRRAGSRSVVVHLLCAQADRREAASPPPRVGFVVGRSVGGAVVRNRVRRRLRHLVRERLPGELAGATVVVRALPASRDSSHEELGLDLDRCLQKLGFAPGLDTMGQVRSGR